MITKVGGKKSNLPDEARSALFVLYCFIQGTIVGIVHLHEWVYKMACIAFFTVALIRYLNRPFRSQPRWYAIFLGVVTTLTAMFLMYASFWWGDRLRWG